MPFRPKSGKFPVNSLLAVRRQLTRFGVLTTHPAAYAIVLIYAGLWFVFQRETFDWHAVATLATWMMTLFITRSGHRDTQAIEAKLDELLRVHGDARNNSLNWTIGSLRRLRSTASGNGARFEACGSED